MLKHSLVKKNLKPDLIIQIGSTLVSTEIQDLIYQNAQNDRRLAHVLLHKHRPTERADPSGTVTHKITSEVASFLPLVTQVLEVQGHSIGTLGSQLAPIVYLGREIGKHMPSIIRGATENVKRNRERVWNEAKEKNVLTLSEPEIVLAISEVLCSMNSQQRLDLFLSNSMPVRDSEFFLYPNHDYIKSTPFGSNQCLGSVSVNRGASGIDGIISSATGFVEATSSPTTLLIGDLATLHDLNAFHHLSSRSKKPMPPLTTIIVNNDGGGIFSFLPIAKFGNDVGFEEFFGTPTNSFSFGKGAEAFGIPYEKVSNFEGFKDIYKQAVLRDSPMIIEAQVVDREENVQIHKEITAMTLEKIDDILSPKSHDEASLRLPAKFYRKEEIKHRLEKEEIERETEVQQFSKTLVLLHGWMGDKNEWDKAAMSLMQDLPDDWSIISVDLPGHGESHSLYSWPKETLRKMLNIDSPIEEIIAVENARMSNDDLSVDKIADLVLHSLSEEYGLKNIDALAGYSLGGRIALSMKKLCSSNSFAGSRLVSDSTQLILLGAYPGDFDSSKPQIVTERLQRISKDKALSDRMLRIYESSFLFSESSSVTTFKMWAQFLSKWYSNRTLWGDLQNQKLSEYQGMTQRRVETLSKRAPDLARVLEMCSPGRNRNDYWKYISPDNTYFLAGELDKKYSIIGKEWTNVAESLQYIEVKGCGHALLVESPEEVSNIMTNILSERKKPNTGVSIIENDQSVQQNLKTLEERNIMVVDNPTTQVKPGIFDMELFAIEMSESKNGKGVKGIGWGEQGKTSNEVSERRGFIISIASNDGRFVGIGEVSPLEGVHSENLEEVRMQLQLIQDAISEKSEVPIMECEQILALDGSMKNYIDLLVQSFSLEHLQPMHLAPSVRSGLEMSLMALASEAVRFPLPRALMLGSPSITSNVLPINGLVTRGVTNASPMRQEDYQNSKSILYSSMKIKVGHRRPAEDAQTVVNTQLSLSNVNVRADANRAWNESSAIDFVNELSKLDNNIQETLEFIEEPLEKQSGKNGGQWNFPLQVNALEKWHAETGIKYALDESLADFVLDFQSDEFEVLTEKIQEYLLPANGCAALVLKPTVLGMELSLRLAKFAHNDLGIGAVFTSTFESGVGLAFTSFLATVSDANIKNPSLRYPHGISTFSVLNDDTLSPPFESYVKEDGTIKIAPLGRAIYGLSLDEIRDYFYTIEEVNEIEGNLALSTGGDYQAMSSTSDTGREISIQVSLPLPFSDDIACSRFTDLPQQPRWSPWLNSVSYLGKGQTEWTLNVRGVEFRWKAMSKFLDNPKGILWESTSGLKNKGRVEFIKVSDDSCLMKVTMTIITPRIIALVFKTTGEFVKEFVESKLLKWSLESFRDVVKADLALERGDAELGDALYGAVEGRSNAIEATLSYQGFEDIP